jgi:MFS superfamily sulfate permease-like transporter
MTRPALLIALDLLLLLLTATPTSAYLPQYTVCEVVTFTAVRLAPADYADIIQYAQPGDTFRVVAELSTWLVVDVQEPGLNGFIQSSACRVVDLDRRVFAPMMMGGW